MTVSGAEISDRKIINKKDSVSIEDGTYDEAKFLRRMVLLPMYVIAGILGLTYIFSITVA